MPQTQIQAARDEVSHAVPRFLAALRDDSRDMHWVRAIRRARTRRDQFFNARLFADPAWDMLLELYMAELEQRRISIGGLCSASEVPATTGMRWLDALSSEGLVSRRDDPLDKRRTFISLSPRGTAAMRSFFNSLPTGAAML